MPRVLVMHNKKSRNFADGAKLRTNKEANASSRVLSLREKANRSESTGQNGSVELSLIGVGFFVIIFAVFSCAFYLFQVNNLASMGYEMKEKENLIQKLEAENKKMQIQEIELKSMYALEKATENLNLVSSNEVSYIEIKGPVAMK